MSVGNGADLVFKVTMASGVTLSSLVDLGAAWKTVYMQIPTMTSGTEIYLKAGLNTASTDGFRIMHPPVNTATAQLHTFSVASGVTQRVVPVPGGIRNMFVEYSTATTATSQTFYFYCGN